MLAPGQAAAGCPLGEGAGIIAVRFVRPGEAAHLEGGHFWIDIPSGSRFAPGPLVVRTVSVTGLPEGLRAVHDAVDVLPEGEALDARATLAFDVGETPEVRDLGVFRWDAVTARYGFESDEFHAPQRAMVVPFRRYGRFALLRDEAAPVIRSVRPIAGETVGRRPEFAAWVDDTGKGLRFDGVAFTLDEARLESEFDPDRGVSRPFEAPVLSPGRHHLRVVATDRAGNVSPAVEVDFTAR